MATLRESAVLIKDKEGNFRGVLDVARTLDYIEEMREKKIPDASITDRLRNELTDILMGLDDAVSKIQQQKPAPAPAPEPRPQRPKAKVPEPEQEYEDEPEFEDEPEPEPQPKQKRRKGTAEEIAQEFEGIFDDE